MSDPSIVLEPGEWQTVLKWLLAPVAWIPAMQRELSDFLLHSSSGWAAAAKFLLLALPALLFVGAVWCTTLSVYTLAVRSQRRRYAATLLIAWWDAARAVWSYWTGLFRFALVAAGWMAALGHVLVKLAGEAIRQLVITPFIVAGRLSRLYFRGRVPWIAALLLVGWCVLEASIFTQVLFPAVVEFLSEQVAVETPGLAGPVLHVALVVLFLGSFSCLRALLEAVRRRRVWPIARMAIVVLFAVSFEVAVVYRALADALAPWVAGRTGLHPGELLVFSLALSGWVAVRGTAWFLFGRHGATALLALISRGDTPSYLEVPLRRGADDEAQPAPLWTALHAGAGAPLETFKPRIEWLHRKSDEVLEYLTLPVLQVLAAMLNFGTIVLVSKPVFELPLKNVQEALDTGQILSRLGLKEKRFTPPTGTVAPGTAAATPRDRLVRSFRR